MASSTKPSRRPRFSIYHPLMQFARSAEYFKYSMEANTSNRHMEGVDKGNRNLAAN